MLVIIRFCIGLVQEEQLQSAELMKVEMEEAGMGLEESP